MKCYTSIIISYICLVVKYIWRFNLDRHACITSKMLKELEKIFTGLLNDKSCDILEFGGENDHVHILFEAPPQVQLSKIVNTLKTVSSRPKHLKKYYRKSAFWSRSYCIVSTGGATIDIIKEYIQNQ